MSLRKMVQTDENSVSCYIDEIPQFIDAELAKLYGALHSSLPFFKVFRSIEDVSCYVVTRNNVPIVILLFKIKNRNIEILNEMIEIDPAEIDRFTRHVLMEFPQIDIINFKALKTVIGRFGYPMQKYKSKDTYMIELPGTPNEYTASIGKSTRTNIRYQNNNVIRNYPSFSVKFYANEDIDEQHIKTIVRFSEQKIKTKDSGFRHNEENIVRLAKMCGFVCVLMINDRVCAGSINYQIGSSYFGEVLGHDVEYDKYGLGKLALHQTICESIVRGGRKFYLGGGVFDFKNRMLGMQVSMDELQIYRSYGKLMLNFDKAAKTIIFFHVRQMKSWLHQHKNNLVARCAFKYFYFLKNRATK